MDGSGTGGRNVTYRGRSMPMDDRERASANQAWMSNELGRPRTERFCACRSSSAPACLCNATRTSSGRGCVFDDDSGAVTNWGRYLGSLMGDISSGHGAQLEPQ